MQTSWVDLLHRGWTLSSLLLSPESGVDCPCPWFHANSVCCPASLLSSCQLPASPLSSQLSFASPYHFQIRRDFRSKNPLSCFAPKQTKVSSAWRATHIVLQCSKSRVCCLRTEMIVVTVSLWFWLFRGEAWMSPENVAQWRCS